MWGGNLSTVEDCSLLQEQGYVLPWTRDMSHEAVEGCEMLTSRFGDESFILKMSTGERLRPRDPVFNQS